MSDRCQYDNKCQESTAYECSCKEMPILLCKKHLDIHIISPSERGHKIQPIIVEIFEDSKKIIINEINKLKLKIFKQQDTFIIEAHHLITEIYSNINQGVNKLKQLATDLNKLLDMIHNTNEIRINHRNPDIISIFQYPKDILIEKFEGLQLINFEIEYKRQNIYLNIKENILKNFFSSEERNLVKKTEGKCNKEHKLLLSDDTTEFYGYVNGDTSIPACDYCNSRINNDHLHCRICFLDICNSCSDKKNYRIPRKLACPQNHEMV